MPSFDIEAIDAQVADLFDAGDRADPHIRERVVELALPLVDYLARRFSGRGEPVEDLVQVGSLGLMKSIERFDPDRGVRFSTFATPTILGELKRYFRDSGWAMHVPRRLKERSLVVRSVAERLVQDLGRSPTAKEIAAEAGLTVEEVLEALDAGSGYSLDSLDAPKTEEGVERVAGVEDEAFELLEGWASVAGHLRALPAREREILYLRFVKGLTQSQIGAQVGISQMHVSRILRETIKRLRALATDDGDVPVTPRRG